MHLADAGHVMSAQRSAGDVQQKTGRRMKQRQQMHHRKATAGLLSAGLTELFLQRRRVRHRDARAIDKQCAMAVPAAVIEHRAATQVKTERAQQILQDA